MSGGVVVGGRALHPPWNEGTRVIGRGVAVLAGRDRSVRTVSVTAPEHLDQQDPAIAARHVPAHGSGLASEYATVPSVVHALLAAAREIDATVVHIFGLPLVVASLLRTRGLRVVFHVTVVEHAYATTVDRLRNVAAGRVFDRSVDAYAASAPSVADALMARGVARRRIHLVGPPIDDATFARRPRAGARAALGMDPDAFTVVYVGTVSPARFPAADVAAALLSAATTVPDLALEVFAPVATHGYNREYAETNVRSAADAAGIRARVRLEDLDIDRKALVYSAADVLIVPFTAPVAVEPPLTLLEAMACEAAVCVSPFANRSAVVVDGETGRVAHDASGLAAVLADLAAAGPDGRAALGARARASALARYGDDAVHAQLTAIWGALGV